MERGNCYTPSIDITQNRARSQIYPHHLCDPGKRFLISVSLSLLISKLRITAVTTSWDRLSHSLAPSTMPPELLLSPKLSPCFSQKTSWKIVYGLYLSLVSFYLQLNILWKLLTSINNDLIGNYSPSSCTLLANDEAAPKGSEGFLLGESLKRNWLDGWESLPWATRSSMMERMAGDGDGEGEPKISNREVLIPGLSGVHTQPRKTRVKGTNQEVASGHIFTGFSYVPLG